MVPWKTTGSVLKGFGCCVFAAFAGLLNPGGNLAGNGDRFSVLYWLAFLELPAGIAAGSPECSCKAAMRYIVLLNPCPTGSGG